MRTQLALAALLTVTVLLFPACAKTPEAGVTPESSVYDYAAEPPSETSSPEPGADPLKVYIRSAGNKSNEEAAWEYINGFMQRQGFNLDFVAKYDGDDAFMSMTKKNIGENALFFPPVIWDLTGDTDFMSQVGDFYETAEKVAPNYLQKQMALLL